MVRCRRIIFADYERLSGAVSPARRTIAGDPRSDSTARPRAVSSSPATCWRRRARSRRTRLRPARGRAAGVAPVRPARGHRPQPRPRPRGADRRLPAGWTDDLLYRDRGCTRRTTRASPSCRRPSCRGTGSAGTGSAPATPTAPSTSTPPLVEELLERIRTDGPLSSTDVEPRAAIDWYWRPTNQVRAILEALAEAGILGLARRDGNRRVYDLVERLFPADLLAERRPEREQHRHKLLSRYRAHGLLGAGGQQELWLGHRHGRRRSGRRCGDALIADGLAPAGRRRGRARVPVRRWRRRGERHARRGRRSVAAGDAGRGPARAAASRSWRRSTRSSGTATCCGRCSTSTTSGRSTSRPPKRRWGYYVLPLLFGDRLVGRIEPRFDRAAGALRIIDLWWEAGFDPLGRRGGTGFVGRVRGRPRGACPVRGRASDRAGRGRPAIGRSVSEVRARLGRGGPRQSLTVRVRWSPSARPPVAGLVARADPDVVACRRASRPAQRRRGRGAERVPRAAVVAPLDLEVAEPGGQDLEPRVAAGPADGDPARRGVARRRCVTEPSLAQAPVRSGPLRIDAGPVALAARRRDRPARSRRSCSPDMMIALWPGESIQALTANVGRVLEGRGRVPGDDLAGAVPGDVAARSSGRRRWSRPAACG